MVSLGSRIWLLHYRRARDTCFSIRIQLIRHLNTRHTHALQHTTHVYLYQINALQQTRLSSVVCRMRDRASGRSNSGDKGIHAHIATDLYTIWGELHTHTHTERERERQDGGIGAGTWLFSLHLISSFIHQCRW